jgi:hypothetical protein
MSASDEWQDRHLTPAGWVEGSYRVDGAGITWADDPADRVPTVRHSEFSGWGSNIHRSDDVKWEHEDKNLVAELLAKYGEAPKTL